MQALHLQEYFKKHRKKLLRKKNVDTDKFFMSSGRSKDLEGIFSNILEQVRRFNPKIGNLYHIRTSVVSHWLNDGGLLQAMINAGHCNVTTTQRYDTKKYDKLQEQLKIRHPMEQLDFTL